MWHVPCFMRRMRAPETRYAVDLRQCDVDGLSDTDTLAMLLGGKPRVALARATKLLELAGDASELSRMGFGEVSRQVGEEGARRIACAFALGRRVKRRTSREALADSREVHAWAEGRLAWLEHEELWLLALDARNGLLAARCLARGGAHTLSIAPKDVLVCGLREGARGFLLVHNHPSGDPTPSGADAHFTREVAEAAAIVGMPLLDHVVVAGSRFASVPFFVPDEKGSSRRSAT